ncbi:hypothetical protein BGZ65_007053 [Modicella reniformis]|uniref:Folliculin n=1 Tax=Modicella reniformis TaxID=1440133 RepID=A0A9P6IPX6_9FUNG|nr:hypothetical protein BGZ65_007053 [Modicella reniformis]
MFTVYDAQSRGHRVKYTIMTMMTDRVYLVASMEYLISQFQAIASNLQSMANALCPQQQSPASRSLSYSSSHHRGSIMPENVPTRRGRPLTDVLAKPDIFVQLHAAFVSVLSNCSRRLTERHIQGRPINERALQEQDQQQQPCDSENQGVVIESLRELRRVLGQQQFNRLVWNSVVGNQVIVRGEESRIVHEIIKSLQDVLPKDCCTIIHNGSSYEPTYACNILGLDHSIPIPPDLDPKDFILLDILMETLGHQIPTPPTSLPGNEAISSVYQADWSTATLVADIKDLSTHLEKTATQCRRYLLQAGEELPETLIPNFGNVNGHSSGRTHSPHYQRPLRYIDTVNDILDYQMPPAIEAKRLAILREEWISKSIQFHNLYKTGKASDETVMDGFLQSLRVDKRDLKILRFFTRCAKSSAFQYQKFRSDEPIVIVSA